MAPTPTARGNNTTVDDGHFNDEMTERIMMLEKIVHEKDEIIFTLTTGQRV